MKDIFKTTIEIEVSDVQVDDFYFSFDYYYEIKASNGKEIVSGGAYESDHSWGDNKGAFKQMLENGYGAECVINTIDSKYYSGEE
jgi:hypothetical protein